MSDVSQSCSGGSNGGDISPPLPAVFGARSVTINVAGDSSTNPLSQYRRRRSKRTSGYVQIRLRIPIEFWEILKKLKPSARGLALCIALDERVGKAINLPRLINAVQELRGLRVLLLQYLKIGDNRSAAKEVAESLKLIDTLRRDAP
jgi:hypothetical protein